MHYHYQVKNITKTNVHSGEKASKREKDIFYKSKYTFISPYIKYNKRILLLSVSQVNITHLWLLGTNRFHTENSPFWFLKRLWSSRISRSKYWLVLLLYIKLLMPKCHILIVGYCSTHFMRTSCTGYYIHTKILSDNMKHKIY